MNLEDIKKAGPLIERRKALTNDMEHLQELAGKMANLDTLKMRFKLEMEWEEYDEKLASQQALNNIESGEHDDLQDSLNELRKAMEDAAPPGMKFHIMGPGMNKPEEQSPKRQKKHELDGAITDIVGLQILGTFLSHKIEEIGKIDEELLKMGVEIEPEK